MKTNMTDKADKTSKTGKVGAAKPNASTTTTILNTGTATTILDLPFHLLSADQSLRRPGFALLRCDPDARTVTLLRKWHLQTKSSEAVGSALHGIYTDLIEATRQNEDAAPASCIHVLVREKGFSRFARETQALYKVFGVADLAAWQCGEKVYHELAPLSVKKIITGNGKASKADVAAALVQYVGTQEYACDDESDAVAVGIAWLIQNGYIDNNQER